MNHSKDVVTAFLSCSIRPRDWPLVSAIEEKVLRPMGFRCLTVGANISFAEQTDDAIRRLIDSCECLIGVATERFNARDRDFPSRTLSIATPYLLQETSMAFHSGLPYLMFKTPDVTLLGVTNRNLWIEMDGRLYNGKPGLISKKEVVHAMLRDLRHKALERRARLGRDRTMKNIERLSKYLVGGYVGYHGIDWLLRPECFGDFYYKDPECKECSYKERCKVKKAELRKS